MCSTICMVANTKQSFNFTLCLVHSLAMFLTFSFSISAPWLNNLPTGHTSSSRPGEGINADVSPSVKSCQLTGFTPQVSVTLLCADWLALAALRCHWFTGTGRALDTFQVVIYWVVSARAHFFVQLQDKVGWKVSCPAVKLLLSLRAAAPGQGSCWSLGFFLLLQALCYPSPPCFHLWRSPHASLSN